MAATTVVTPILLPSLNAASKIKYLRFMADRAGIPAENIDEFLLDTPQMALQSMENELLKLNIFVPINPEDNDEEHLVELGTTIQTDQAELHKIAHIEAMIAKGIQPAINQQQGTNEQAMSNSMQSMSMSSANSELQQ